MTERRRFFLNRRFTVAESISESYFPRKIDTAKHPEHQTPSQETPVYSTFDSEVGKLDDELRKLCNAARRLGGSAGILSASTRMRERLERVRRLFLQNIAYLMPHSVKKHDNPRRTRIRQETSGKKKKTRKVLDNEASSRSPLQPVKPEDLARELCMFLTDVAILLDCFNQFSEFVEGLPDWSLTDSQILEWIDSLQDSEDEIITSIHIRESMPQIGEHLSTLNRDFISALVTDGIATVQASQERGMSNLQNQTIVAALFAGIATGMIQVFSSGGSGPLHAWIILLWYMTLIFSVASAVNGLLGLSWMQAVYRSPDSHVPWWVLVWITKFPLVSLVLAVGCFFVALVLFAFTPQELGETRIITTILSFSSCIGLIAVSGWFICELWVFNRYEGRVWLADVLKKVPAVALVWNSWSFSGKLHNNSLKAAGPGASELLPRFVRARDSRRVPMDEGTHTDVVLCLPISHTQGASPAPRPGLLRWMALFNRLREEGLLKSRPVADVPSEGPARLAELTVKAAIRKYIAKLETISMVTNHPRGLGDDAGVVHSLRFSPNGRYLAVCTSKSRPYFLDINKLHHDGHTFEQPTNTGNFVQDVVWSPDSTKLLLRSHHRLAAWQVAAGITDTGFPEPKLLGAYNLDSKTKIIRSACWGPKNDDIIVIEGRRYLGIALSPPQRLWDNSQFLEFRSSCITKNCHWMVGAGRYLQEEDNASRKYAIIVFDVRKSKIAKKKPVLYEISNVALASDNRSILVNFEGRLPSQLWSFTTSLDSESILDLVQHQTYRNTRETSFTALPAVFGGEHDHLVLRMMADGNICIWERDTAEDIYYINLSSFITSASKITSLAWNQGLAVSESAKYMFATGMQDGTIHIWSSHELSLPDAPSLPDEPSSPDETNSPAEAGLTYCESPEVFDEPSEFLIEEADRSRAMHDE